MNSKLLMVAGSAALVVAVVVVGCRLPASGTVYDRRQAGNVQQVEMGVIEDVKTGVLSGRSTTIGTYGGAAAGAAAASDVGSGAGRDLARVGAGIAGAVAGEAVEEAVTRKPAEELTIRLDGGKTVVLVQEQSSPPWAVGDRVRVLTGTVARATRP